MTAAASLLTLALIGAGSIVVVLVPGFLRYWRLRRENEELERRGRRAQAGERGAGAAVPGAVGAAGKADVKGGPMTGNTRPRAFTRGTKVTAAGGLTVALIASMNGSAAGAMLGLALMLLALLNVAVSILSELQEFNSILRTVLRDPEDEEGRVSFRMVNQVRSRLGLEPLVRKADPS